MNESFKWNRAKTLLGYGSVGFFLAGAWGIHWIVGAFVTSAVLFAFSWACRECEREARNEEEKRET